MSAESIFVTAHVKARPGCEGRVGELLRSLVAPTRSEPGCVFYDLYRDADAPGCYLFFEGWKSRADLDEHLRKPYIKKFMDRSGDLLERPIDVSAWTKFDSGQSAGD